MFEDVFNALFPAGAIISLGCTLILAAFSGIQKNRRQTQRFAFIYLRQEVRKAKLGVYPPEIILELLEELQDFFVDDEEMLTLAKLVSAVK
jgi:hypothetical protein